MHSVSQHAPQTVASREPTGHLGFGAAAESSLGSAEPPMRDEGDPTQGFLVSKSLPVLSDASRDTVMELIWANFEVSICPRQSCIHYQ